MEDEELIKRLLILCGEDPDRPGLQETPRRVLDAWGHWTQGYDENPDTIIKTFEDGAEGYDEMVAQLSVPFFSTCEHHMATFFGFAHVAYIPSGKVIGLSKIGRLVDVFAKRLTIQERLTTQVADTLMRVLNPLGVGVVVQARHTCMESRGIQKIGTVTVTSVLRGCFKEDPAVRGEFLSLVNQAVQGRAASL